jgi:alpha-tubulin suppressor-like RCC1 family protein
MTTTISGWRDSYMIMDDDSLWAWGAFGGVFEVTEEDWTRPIRVMEDVTAISDGMVIRGDGTLWGWGNNERGQLGDGTTTHRFKPVKILEDSVAVSGTWSYIMAITSGGTLWGWGSNQNGQLGDGTTEDRHNPVRIMDDVIAVSAGFNTMAVTTDGTLWAWGRDIITLEDGSRKDSHIPMKIMDDVIYVVQPFVITSDNTLWVLRSGEEPRRIMEDVTNISIGGYTNMVITSDGILWGWGRNRTGVLGDGTTRDRSEPVKIMENVVSVSTNGSHTLAVTADGNLWAWGENTSGELGIGTYRGEYEQRPYRGSIPSAWLSPVLVLEYVPEG